ncbi:SEC-C metal-binding domain-containing protein [Rhodopirellula sallentina]|uniref:SEC-C metal-binding domain-containing protein n=1 Tax=Rhodopirellula sallentina TaxID=1263869 RepID=UPI0005C7C93B|nr:SEC-C metal-binding domain-containing protein [Rhodopirellula sallentina]
MWHEVSPDRWSNEIAIGASLLDDFQAGIDSNGKAFMRGKFNLYSQHGHLYETIGLRIEYPSKFPHRNVPPCVFLESHRGKWKNTGNSHIESDWKFCLFVPGESGIIFADSTSLNDLFAVVHTFLIKQRIYQRRLAASKETGVIAEWPGEDRSHGEQGIREAIQAMRNVGRNSPCPCGSGKKYKQCHLHQNEQSIQEAGKRNDD